MSINIGKIAQNVDQSNKGNRNGYIDTVEERSLFISKLEDAGISNASKIVINYTNQSTYYESIFASKNITSSASQDYLIMSYLNKDSYLNINKDNLTAESESIYNDIKRSIRGWGTNEKRLGEALNKLNKHNVLKVIDDNLIDDIVNDLTDDETSMMLPAIIALVDLANQRGIDVSDIITYNYDTSNGYSFSVANQKDDCDNPISATDKKYVAKVIKDLKARIESMTKLSTESANNDSDKIIQINHFAKIADQQGDNNGYVNGKEVSVFKNLCEKVGILVNDILSGIDINAKEEDLSEVERAIKLVFDENTNLYGTQQSSTEEIKNLSDNITKGIKEKDINVDGYLSTLNADNIMDVLAEFDKDNEFKKLKGKYPVTRYGYDGIPYNDFSTKTSNENDIGAKLIYAFGRKSNQYTKYIVAALYDKASQYNRSEADGIVFKSGDGYKLGSNASIGKYGDDALDRKYVNDVITKLVDYIKEQENQNE